MAKEKNLLVTTKLDKKLTEFLFDNSSMSIIAAAILAQELMRKFKISKKK